MQWFLSLIRVKTGRDITTHFYLYSLNILFFPSIVRDHKTYCDLFFLSKHSIFSLRLWRDREIWCAFCDFWGWINHWRQPIPRDLRKVSTSLALTRAARKNTSVGHRYCCNLNNIKASPKWPASALNWNVAEWGENLCAGTNSMSRLYAQDQGGGVQPNSYAILFWLFRISFSHPNHFQELTVSVMWRSDLKHLLKLTRFPLSVNILGKVTRGKRNDQHLQHISEVNIIYRAPKCACITATT